jgi:hypothetical protein
MRGPTAIDVSSSMASEHRDAIPRCGYVQSSIALGSKASPTGIVMAVQAGTFALLAALLP